MRAYPRRKHLAMFTDAETDDLATAPDDLAPEAKDAIAVSPVLAHVELRGVGAVYFDKSNSDDLAQHPIAWRSFAMFPVAGIMSPCHELVGPVRNLWGVTVWDFQQYWQDQ